MLTLDSSKKNIAPHFFIFFFLSLLIFFLNRFGFLKPVTGILETVIVPVKTSVYHLKQSNKNQEDFQNVLQKQENIIVSLESQILVLKKENESMKKLLGIPLPSNWQFQVAQIIGNPASDLQIDKGEKDGVGKGMVVVDNNFLVGKLSWIGQHFSKVMLPISADSKILGITQSSGNGSIKSKGIIQGQGGKMTFEKVLIGETLEEGDLVLTAGGDELPANLLVGKVGKVDKKEWDVYQKGEIVPLVDFSKLERVFVVIKR